MAHKQRSQKGQKAHLALKRRLRANLTPAEKILWAKLRSKQFQAHTFRRQHGIGPFIVDFYCAEKRLVIEVDGDVHANSTNLKKDIERERYLRAIGLVLVRYTNDEVLNNLDGVLEDLIGNMLKDSTSPRPSFQRRGNLKSHLVSIDSIDDNPLDQSKILPNLLPRKFFNRPTLRVAQDLLGKYLVREQEGKPIQARIVDVEAYIGPDDLACHASKGRTKRTEVMFGPAGVTYVYLIYGMYDLLNIVTGPIDFPAAILIRGIEVTGMGKDDLPTRPTRIDGPGKLTRFLQIDRSLNGWDTTQGHTLWIEDHQEKIARKHILALPRIGINYAGEWAHKPWRLCLQDRTKTTSRSRLPKNLR
ncbi:MAG: DNA-3-methyladenine glycosylase [Nitrospirae bacterium]|jgi:DNA-3-methyladenine glycosylase|nr:DNA-3-methyladenine glycosylase [Nitrospirota bacterium]